jgi:hypothetical protein
VASQCNQNIERTSCELQQDKDRLRRVQKARGTNGIFEGAYRFVKSNRVVVIVVVAVVVIVVAPKHNLLFEYVICNLESNLNSSSIHRRTETVTVVTNPMKKATHAINSLLYNNCRRFGSQSL